MFQAEQVPQLKRKGWVDTPEKFGKDICSRFRRRLESIRLRPTAAPEHAICDLEPGMLDGGLLYRLCFRTSGADIDKDYIERWAAALGLRDI